LATIGRAATAGGAVTNLANASSMTLPLNTGNGYRMYQNGSASGFAAFHVTVVDTPGIGTWYYSPWIYITAVGTATVENTFFSIIQVAP